MLNLLIFISLCWIWGSTWLAIKIGLDGVPPFWGAGLRFLIASAFLSIITAIAGKWKIPLRQNWRMILIVGLFMYPVPYGLVYWGSQYVESGMAAVLFAIMPIFVAILAHLFIQGERLTFAKIVGMLLGFSGIIVIFADNLGAKGSLGILGMICVAFSPFFSSLATILAKKHFREINPLPLTAIHTIFGGIGLLAVSVFTESRSNIIYDSKTVGSIFYLGIIGTAIAFSLYFYLLKTMEATKISMIAFITPLVALFLGIVFRSEVLDPLSILGSLMVVIGVFIVVMGDNILRARLSQKNRLT